MSDKIDAIQQAKENQEVVRQGQKREEAKEKAEAAQVKPAEKKAEAPKAEKKDAPKKLLLDRILVVPIYDAYKKSRSHRGRRAMSLLKEFIARHAKTPIENVRIATQINSLILARGSRNPPKRVKVRVAKDGTGIASVTLVVSEADEKASETREQVRKAKKDAQRASSRNAHQKAFPKAAPKPAAPAKEAPKPDAKAAPAPAPKAVPA